MDIGYDIDSFDENGKKLYIEVKTCSDSKKRLNFYLTNNELDKLMKKENYQIYYLFDINKMPKLHIVNKEKLLEGKDKYLKPIIYKIDIDVENIDEKGKY